MDLSIITNMHALINYIANYISKNENKSEIYKEIYKLCDIKDNNN